MGRPCWVFHSWDGIWDSVQGNQHSRRDIFVGLTQRSQNLVRPQPPQNPGPPWGLRIRTGLSKPTSTSCFIAFNKQSLMRPRLGLVLGLLLRSRYLFLEWRMREELSEDQLEMDGWWDEVVVMPLWLWSISLGWGSEGQTEAQRVRLGSQPERSILGIKWSTLEIVGYAGWPCALSHLRVYCPPLCESRLCKLKGERSPLGQPAGIFF